MAKPGNYFAIQKFRPNPLPVEGLPLALRAVGHFNASKGPILQPQYSTYTVIAWGINGRFKITTDDMGKFVLTPQNIAVITPGHHCILEAITDNCEFRYMAFDGPQCESIILKAGLWAGLFPSREVPLDRLEFLAELVASDRCEDRLLAISRVYDLITYQTDIARGLMKDNLVYQAQWHIQKNWRDCQMRIESILDFLNVDRTTLSTRFKNETGISMLEYITNLRIGGAKRLLRTTSEHVLEVAKMCGFNDPSYFTRTFHKKTGFSPNDYRLYGTKKIANT